MKYNHFEGRKKMKIENFRKLKFSMFKKKEKFKVRQVKSNRCLRPEFITVNQHTLCRFVCVCRTDMRVRAFESPDPGLCVKYPNHGR